MVSESIALDHFHGFELLQARLLAYLVLTFIRIVLEMAHVSDVADITNLVTQMPQEFEQYIVGYSRPGVAQMGVAVYGRAADIHTHMTFMDRFEKFLVLGKGVRQIKIPHLK